MANTQKNPQFGHFKTLHSDQHCSEILAEYLHIAGLTFNLGLHTVVLLQMQMHRMRFKAFPSASQYSHALLGWDEKEWLGFFTLHYKLGCEANPADEPVFSVMSPGGPSIRF